jgi:hypothetical protein
MEKPSSKLAEIVFDNIVSKFPQSCATIKKCKDIAIKGEGVKCLDENLKDKI